MRVQPNKASDDGSFLLKPRGYRLTGPRYCVIEILAKSERALTALDIYNEAHQSYPALGLVSIYRTLDKLESLGLIQRVHQLENYHSYMAAPQGHEHLLVYHNCGKVEFFAGDNLNSLMNVVEKRSGYKVQGHWLQLFGFCQDCQNHRLGDPLLTTN